MFLSEDSGQTTTRDQEPGNPGHVLEHRGAGRILFRGLLRPFADAVGGGPLEDLRDLDRENDDEEGLQQAADAFGQGQEQGADVERGEQIDKRSDDASKQIVEQVIKVVRRPLRDGLQAPQDNRLANRQADEDAEEDRGGDQVVGLVA